MAHGALDEDGHETLDGGAVEPVRLGRHRSPNPLGALVVGPVVGNEPIRDPAEGILRLLVHRDHAIQRLSPADVVKRLAGRRDSSDRACRCSHDEQVFAECSPAGGTPTRPLRSPWWTSAVSSLVRNSPMSTNPTIPARRPRRSADLSRLANLRDAGDVPDTATRVMPAGVLYRSDAPLPGDRRPLGLRWPPRTVVDLREPDERGPGPHPLDRPGTAVTSLPLVSALPAARQASIRHGLATGEITLIELYRGLLDGAATWVPALMRVAAHQPGPLLVHCAAGKDRTGVAVALLLAAAGAPRWHIMADYMRTAHHRHAVLARAHPHRPDVPEHLADAPAAAIEAVLERIGPDPAAFLAAHDVPDATARRWRHRASPAVPH
jgi:protein-tyrosine phosphatase